MPKLSLSRKIEDYLENIFWIHEQKGYIKVKDIADAMKVKPPSVVEMLKRLHELDLIKYIPHGGITFTKKGYIIGKNTAKSHEIFVKLLTFLGLSEKTAKKDACELEHHLTPETAEAFLNFVEFLNTKQGNNCKAEFEEYLKIKELKKTL